jgi:hypothetical protein
MNKTTLQLVEDGYLLPLSKKLLNIIKREQDKANIPAGSAAYLHFRDPTYSASTGGFRPVEIFISEAGDIQYITEYGYVGIEPMTELAKSADFDFSQIVFQDFSGCYELDTADIRSFWKLWQGNFISYFEMGVYTVEVKEGP